MVIYTNKAPRQMIGMNELQQIIDKVKVGDKNDA